MSRGPQALSVSEVTVRRPLENWSTALEGEPGRAWTGVIGMVERGEADLACSGLAITSSVQRAVEFTKPFVMGAVTFAIMRAERLRLKNAYLYPFHFSVWACFFFVFFVMTAATWIVFEKKYSVGKIVFEICGNTLRQPFTLGGGSWKSKFLLGIICLYGLVMTSGYSGVLLSFMTVSMQGETVETLEQLSEAVAKGTHRCHVVKGTLLIPYLLNTKQKHLVVLAREISQNKWFLEKMDTDALKVISPNDAIATIDLMFKIAYRGTLQRQTKYLISKDIVSLSPYGIAMNRKFCCKKKLNRIITGLFEGGMVEKYVREAAFENWLKNKEVEEDVEIERKISIEDLSGALIILCAGYAISFLTLLAEILHFKCCENNNVYCLSK